MSIRKSLLVLTFVASMAFLGVSVCSAQQAGSLQPATAANPAAMPIAPAAGHQAGSSLGIVTVIQASGAVGIMIWLVLFGNLATMFYFIADCGMKIRAVKIMPPSLVQNVTQAMSEGDVLKALKHCEVEPGPLSNVLTAGFANVEEGFETIQDMVGAAAEMESEKLLQRVTYLNVVSNMGPLLGLLGTVHGMIYAFATLATTQAGAAQQALLAINIAESLYCTAAGLITAIPALAAYYYFKNLATRIILGMEAMTLDLIKSLRNIEVVSE
jgi:biopolymer transport protein ExbB